MSTCLRADSTSASALGSPYFFCKSFSSEPAFTPTLMEQLFKQKTYRSPWLWSVYHATVLIKKLVKSEIIVICDPVAAGSERGPRNCGVCDKHVKLQLKEFSSTQNLDKLLGLECDCYVVYRSVLNTEHLSNGMGITNIYE